MFRESKIYISGKGEVPLKEALEIITEEWLNDGQSCTQTTLDLKNVLMNVICENVFGVVPFDLSNPDGVKFENMPEDAQEEMQRHLVYTGGIYCGDTGEFPSRIYDGFPYGIQPSHTYDLSNPNKIAYNDLPKAVRSEMDKLGPDDVDALVGEVWKYSKTEIRHRGTCAYRPKEEEVSVELFDLSNPGHIKFKDIPKDVREEYKKHLEYTGAILCLETGFFLLKIDLNYAYAIQHSHKYDLSNPNHIQYYELPKAVRNEMDKLGTDEVEVLTSDNSWITNKTPVENRDDNIYRQLQVSEYEEWTAEDVPMLCRFRKKDIPDRIFCGYNIQDDGIILLVYGIVTWEYLFKCYEYSTDGKIWRPCRKVKE